MKYSNQVRRKSLNMPCKECLVFPICVTTVKTAIECSILYNSKIPHNRLWKRINNLFNNRVRYLFPDDPFQGYL